jgi:hypothetical protein
MFSRSICRASAFVCLLLGAAFAPAAARIDATTRNHSAGKEAVLIAENGAAKLPIVVSDKATAEIKARAEDLAGYLGKITGAKFEVKTGSAGPGILVGTIQDFPTPSAAEGLKIYNFYDGKEAFAIRTEGGSVKLLGATEKGVGYATARFLEIFGCRWFFEGPAWEVVPKASKLTFNINETDRPEVLSRYFGYPFGQHFEKTDPDSGAAIADWWRRNRVGKSLNTTVGHCSNEIANRFAKEFDAHPEYWALQGDGKRKPNNPANRYGQHCVTNPDVIKMAIQYAREFFDKNPNADMVGVGPDDCAGWCTCPNCAKLGNPGNLAFYLANQVAKALQQSHPGKYVGLYAYNWHCDPPDFQLEPNVYVELTTALLLNTKYGFDRLLELWPTKCKTFGLYDYWAVYDWIHDALPSGRTGNLRYVEKELPRYMKSGIVCLNAESGNSWGSQGLGYYLASRVLWNSSANVDALKADFYDKAFGPAAAAMKTYYERIDLGNSPLVGPTFYRLCLDDLDAALKAVAGRPDIEARIELLRQYNVYVFLWNQQNSAKGKAGLSAAEQKKPILELLNWTYRIRNGYMIFWDFFCDQTTQRLGDENQEPAWKWYQMRVANKEDQIPYRVPGGEPTRAETDAWFTRIRKVYGEPVKVNDIAFGRKLVALTEGLAPPATAASSFSIQDSYLVAIVSPKGDPLRFTVSHGTIYKNFPNGKYILEDGSGKEIARGEVPYGETKLSLKVPSPGVYYFRYNDLSAGSIFGCDAGVKAAFLPERGKGYAIQNNWYTWFYVPKGTREIQFYALGGGGNVLGMADPDGHWRGPEGPDPAVAPGGADQFFKNTGAFQSVPVRKGQDGKMWTLHCAPGHLHFFNIPTILSLSHDALIVPEEVAKNDGL